MASDLNMCTLTGRTTKEPEVRYSNKAGSDLAIANFCLAVDISSKNKKEATFIDCVAFGKTAEVIEKYVSKGNRICVSGNIRKDSYEKDGKTYYNTKVYVNQIVFMESKNNNGGSTTASNDFMSIPDGMEDNLPFN